MPEEPSSAQERAEKSSRGPGRRGSFLRRLGSTLVLWAVVVGTIASSNSIAYFALVAALALLSLWEFFRMVALPGVPGRGRTMLLFSGVYLALLFRAGHGGGIEAGSVAVIDSMALVALFVWLLLAEFRFSPEAGGGVSRVVVSLFGFLWIPFLFGFVLKILFLPGGGGVYYVLLLTVVTKFTDMGAYITGSLVGRTPFMAHISPKKTWEGIAGGIGFAVGASLVMAWLLGEKLPGIAGGRAALIGVILGLAAVAGDLAESVVKRTWATKDSGQVLPGIGGTLDLIDSVCFTAPLLYFYLIFTT
ncbi:MAG: phosphatidate cytidylyltransferase [Verrucomicrobiales bacterium]